MKISVKNPFIIFLFSFCLFVVAGLYNAAPANAGWCYYKTGNTGEVIVDGLGDRFWDPTKNCVQPGGNGQYCPAVGLNWFYKGACVLEGVLQTDAKACYPKRRVFDGETGCTNQCTQTRAYLKPIFPANGVDEILCGDVCKVPITTASTVCENANKNTDPCTGSCAMCKSGFVLGGDGATCVLPYSGIAAPLVFNTAKQITLTTESCEEGMFLKYFKKNTSSPLAWGCASSSSAGGSGTKFGTGTITLTVTAANGENSTGLRVDSSGNWAIKTCADGEILRYSTAYGGIGGWQCASLASLGQGTYRSASDRTYDYYRTLSPRGYALAYNACNWSSGAHVCTADEILKSYNASIIQVGDSSYSGQAWINNGPPGYKDSLVNDCKGWTASDENTYGSFWDFDKDAAYIANCTTPLPFACCR